MGRRGGGWLPGHWRSLQGSVTLQPCYSGFGILFSVMGNSWASIGVIRSNLHLMSPWKEAQGSRMDVGDRSGLSDETLRWVRLWAVAGPNYSPRANPAQSLFL